MKCGDIATKTEVEVVLKGHIIKNVLQKTLIFRTRIYKL